MQQFSNLLSWRLFAAQRVSGIFPPIIGSSMTAVAASGFTFLSWWQSCCVHHNTKVKPEAATAVIELPMMGGRTLETRWAANKHPDNKLENCCIWLVIYLNCTMMHGLTNLKFLSTICPQYYITVELAFSTEICLILLTNTTVSSQNTDALLQTQSTYNLLQKRYLP
jgi:hypothetical protein